MSGLGECIVCDQPLQIGERQTCPPCLAHARSAIMEIIELYALLPDELEGRAGARKPLNPTGRHGGDEQPIPGGDVLIMLAHGSTMWRSEEDLDSIPGLLDRWANDWREHLGISVKLRMQDITTSTGFLLRALDPMAREHPTFAEFARDTDRALAHLRRVTRTANPIELGVACPYCKGRLARHYKDAIPCQHPLGAHREACDQGGRQDDWICSGTCGRWYDERAYNLAVWHNWNQRQLADTVAAG